MNTNGLSPLMQAAVGGEPQTIPGQSITKEGENFMFSPGEGMEPVPVQDPEGLLEVDENGLVMDNDYSVEETEGGLVVKGVSGADPAPGMPDGPGAGAMGGVGNTPMEMASPYKNYKNPQDYKAFNFGNEPTPFNKYKKSGY